MGKKRKTKPKQTTQNLKRLSTLLTIALSVFGGSKLIQIQGGTIIFAPGMHYHNENYLSATMPAVDTSARSTTSGIVIEPEPLKENRWVDGQVLTYNDLVAWKEGNGSIFLYAIEV